MLTILRVLSQHPLPQKSDSTNITATDGGTNGAPPTLDKDAFKIIYVYVPHAFFIHFTYLGGITPHWHICDGLFA